MKRRWCVECEHFCSADCANSCGTGCHRYNSVEPAGPALFTQVVQIVCQVADAEEAAGLSRDAARKLGFDATQIWIEAQLLAARRREQ